MKAKQRKEQRFAFAVIAVAVVIAVLASLSGCVTRKACEAKFGVCGDIAPLTETVEYRDVFLPAKTVTDTFRFPMPMPVFFGESTDSTVRLFRTVPRVHSSKNVRLEWMNDSTLVASATCDSARVRGVDRVITKTQIKEKTVEVEVTPRWVWFVIGGFALFLVVLFAVRR